MNQSCSSTDGRVKMEESPEPSTNGSITSFNEESLHTKRLFSSLDQSDSTDLSPRARKPMRKRAKTQEEKEARAQERVMRNRAAAQVSRERKREYVVTLEAENRALQEQVSTLTDLNTTLQTSVTSLTQRLESVEKMLSYFLVPGTIPRSVANDVPDASPLSATGPTFDLLPTPPGTIRPFDMQSSPIKPTPGTFIDSRNPAVIASGPQRRSMNFPWTLSSHSQVYQQMETILTFWTTILRVTTSQAFATQLNFLLCLSFQRQSSCRTVKHRRSLATCPQSERDTASQAENIAESSQTENEVATGEQRTFFVKGIREAPRF